MQTFKWISFCLLLAAAPARGDDWTQFRGPHRMDISSEKGDIKDWPEDGPPRLWLNKEAGLGYAGYSIVGDTLYTMGSRDDIECLIALNVDDGAEKWSTPVGPRLENDWGDGPRDTPTVDGDFVYALGAKGGLVCAQRADGKVIWKADLLEFGGKIPTWGYTESVLVDGEKVVCTPGGPKGALLALNKQTGEKIWQSSDITDGAHYSSSIVVVHNGQRQYIHLLEKKVVGVDAETGKLLWEGDWQQGKTAVIPTPIYHDGYVFITSGYGAGCKLFKLDSEKPTDVYDNKTMKNHHGGVVLVGDNLYGYSDGVGWLCMNFLTGEKVWSDKEKLGKGSVTCIDGMLVLLSEDEGKVVLIEASPEGWKEHGRFKLDPQTALRKAKGKIWTHPVVANGRLFLRDQELLSAYDLKAK